MSRYALEFQRSLYDPEGFWVTRRDDRLVPAAGRWCWTGRAAVLPVVRRRGAEHLLQRGGPARARRPGQQTALIYDSPVTGTQRTYTYAELLDEVARFAGVLRGLGVDKGDRVIVYMPMVPEAAIAMLACARIGAVHSVVFGGFAAPELASGSTTPRRR